MGHVYAASVRWERGDAVFTDRRYSRGHLWVFDGGVEVPASASPSIVRLPFSRADAVDPEEAFVAALASCHMLFVLDFAAQAGFRIDSYRDEASGEIGRNERGKFYMARATLRPALVFSGVKRPSAADIDALHHRAHDECFIANSVVTEVTVAPEPAVFA